jgi:hypothetical protein
MDELQQNGRLPLLFMCIVFGGMNLLIHEVPEFFVFVDEILLELIWAMFEEHDKTERRNQKDREPEDVTEEGHGGIIVTGAVAVNGLVFSIQWGAGFWSMPAWGAASAKPTRNP